MTLRTLYIQFDLPLYPRQVNQWRGAFIELAGLEDDLLHNHQNDFGIDLTAHFDSIVAIASENTAPANDLIQAPIPSPNPPISQSPYPPSYHYRYPLVQYRIRQGKAAIFAINEGIEAIQTALFQHAWQIRWEDKPQTLQITGMQMNEYTLCMSARPRSYNLFKWLALNEANYEKWQRCQHLTERIALLERVLTAHILAFAGSVSWRVPEQINVQLQQIKQMQQVTYHGTELLAFNIGYTANVWLPPHIALGKAVSHGFGWQVPMKGKR